ncbi:MAG: inositol monophosphatase, monophosphatase [Candidatus Saccharibacteria bacterium]|nr:inositol monophosphatase, monophosphatase [Candidatus Saccharibacteria bacterium]
MSSDDQVVIDTQALVVDVFKGFRDELLGVFGNTEHTSKLDHSPVTIYDVKVEEALKAKLAEAFPDMGFEGEETGASGNSETYWLVDPIDGTSSFIRGLPFSTNMAALVHDGEVIAAVVYDFVNDFLYTALKGRGAFKNGEPIHVNTAREQGNLFIYSMTRIKFGHIQEALGELRMRTMLPVGASGHEYMMLAEGKIDGIVNLVKGKGYYDNAPGVFICEEAGAVLLPYDDKKGVYRGQFIIGSPLVTELIEHSGLI